MANISLVVLVIACVLIALACLAALAALLLPTGWRLRRNQKES
ncbi:hypothetical protein [Luteococcus peritonei]|uniref:Uncharacterized protein n=1 Tax=Luteococcus peritonei TaxID=88874 RepID=A0ABW4RX51_9ACTN